jgi:DNA-binding MarR family transcriptional regulator
MTKKTQSPWLTPEQDAAWRGFLFTSLRLNAQLSAAMGASSDLSYTDYMILVALTDQLNDSARLFELTRDLGWEKSRLSHHIGSMIQRDLVTRTSCPDDHRGVVISITPHGLSQLSAEAPHHVSKVRELFIDHLTPEQLSALAALSPCESPTS